MSEPIRMGSRDARAQLGRLVDEAHFNGQQVVLTKNEEPRAVLVPYAWWQQATEAQKGEGG
ncbi:type II toxin-antitoxin system Phd/YefM family antitoxin [Streptomyces sp. NPDC005407]|uniref:type II toxin-antitoxin system Phd/YefM family antitoxin n=1 Tax=Streptomyces sp. NPDC005407 TaxID=3155340 RepID=UPI0033AF8657